MSWIAVGVVGGLVLQGGATYLQNQSGKKSEEAADKQADLQRRSGEARKTAGELEATVLDQQAHGAIASSQRDAQDIERAGRLAESTAPTIGKLVGDIAKESSYNKARALYGGEERGRYLRLQAIEQRKMGEFAVVGGNILAGATESRGQAERMASYGAIAQTGASLFSKYGGKGTDSEATPTSNFYYSGTGAGGDYQYG